MLWAYPERFIGLWGVIVLILIFVWFDARNRQIIRRFGAASQNELFSSLDPACRRWKRGLTVLAVLAIVLSFAGPQLPGKSVYVKNRGLDIVIAVDVSASMLTEDVLPTRLEKAKLELQEFVDQAKGDRIGVVAFAGEAYVQVPLTLDRSAAKIFLKTLSTNLVPVPGTAISKAIRTAQALFDQDDTDNKVLILLTDGEDHESDPVQAAKEAARNGIRIYAVGIGTPKGEVIPIRSDGQQVRFKQDIYGNVVVSKLDEGTLREITQMTQGVYYRTRHGNLEVDRLYSDIRRLTLKDTGSGWIMEYEPLYQWFLVFAVICLCLELALSERKRHA